ncbi:hypothetical protein I302_105798 [Kwoniella bestiolae CBS 10118]|uniref:Uncharacterized protein n=1 Tax=Kwoniella bestiolae CBS 10118 TaxID=1296100 RepID=A0A1B9G261_9TREE|nr:hypothetical protein I302_04919 [Kwoniella bestiolae CBS 10118]OCF25109.1 hypothetical protein I302_04919 [Kwoniella bestiolae CBS 10118]
MPSLETAGSITTMSTSMSGTSSTSTSASSTRSHSSTSSPYVYSYGTSKIVRTAVAAGVIVLALTALVLFIKISSWIRFHQRLRRHNQLTLSLQSEQRANAYEIAAWADEPNTAPVRNTNGEYNKKKEKKSRKERREEIRQIRRGGGNAFMVKEWEGVAS